MTKEIEKLEKKRDSLNQQINSLKVEELNKLSVIRLNELYEFIKEKVVRPDLKVDDRVFVRCEDNRRWLRRHFSRWDDNGNIRCFCDGNSKFTATNPTNSTEWSEYKLPKEER